MNLAERDALVVAKLAAVAPLTGRQAVAEVIRILGRDFINVAGTDLDTDVSGLQTAVTDLSNTANRTAASTLLSNVNGSTGTRLVQTPRPASIASTDHFRMRLVASGN